MGCHIDGFIAVVAHTHVLQDGPVTGRAADVIAAANTAAEVALRLVRPGKKVLLAFISALLNTRFVYPVPHSIFIRRRMQQPFMFDLCCPLLYQHFRCYKIY